MRQYHNPNSLIGNKEKAILHIAKDELDLSRENYEAVLLGASGGKKDSAAHLTYAEYDRALANFKERGFKVKGSFSPRGAKRKRSAKGNTVTPYVKAKDGKNRTPGLGRDLGDFATADKQAKIYALWADVARVKTQAALRAFIKRRLRIEVDSIAWLNEYEANKVIEALKAMQGREIKTPKIYDGPISGYGEE